MKKQRRTLGAFFKVKLDEHFHTYGRILTEASYAFYDCRTDVEIVDLPEIATKPILFITAVNDFGIQSGYWPKIGTLPLEDNLKRNPLYYMPDLTGRESDWRGSVNRAEFCFSGTEQRDF